MSPEPLGADTIVMVWGVSLGLLLVVALVVTLLLEMIRRTARQILSGAGAIWTQGQLVAGNTIQIPLMLGRVVRLVTKIRGEVEVIGGAADAIRTHADACPSCPDCVLHRREG